MLVLDFGVKITVFFFFQLDILFILAETPPGEESGAQRKTKSRIIKDERVIQSRQQMSGQESSTSTGNSLLPASGEAPKV